MANMVDEFYKIRNGKVVNIYMTYGEFWALKLTHKANGIFESYDEALRSIKRK